HEDGHAEIPLDRHLRQLRGVRQGPRRLRRARAAARRHRAGHPPRRGQDARRRARPAGVHHGEGRRFLDVRLMQTLGFPFPRTHVVRAVMLLALLAAAWPAAAQDKPRSGGELIFVVPSEPPTYDAHAEGTFGVVHPIGPHYNTLLRVDPFDRTGSKIVGDLAESWTVSRDGLTYALKLRVGVKFHDGTVMTSRDVKATYDRIVNPAPGLVSYRKGQYR